MKIVATMKKMKKMHKNNLKKEVFLNLIFALKVKVDVKLKKKKKMNLKVKKNLLQNVKD